MTHKSQLFSFIITTIFVGLLANCGPSNPDNTVEPSPSQTDTSQSTTETGQKAETSDKTNATSNKPTLVYYQMPG
jgi:hypothetical protein